MTPTKQRDHAGKLAKTNTEEALEIARAIEDPWFKAQALCWVARFSRENPKAILKEAAEAAAQGDDAYKRTAVRAWEVAAFADRQCMAEARDVLAAALVSSKDVEPRSSRAEALMLLLQAALHIDHNDAREVYAAIAADCSGDPFWRCQRAVRDGAALLAGTGTPRKFFW